jgi:tetratricopeptide (TPR) repeat protein
MLEKKAESARSSLGPIVIVLFACFAVYFNSLFNGFVYDDNTQVLENPWIKDVGYLPEIFSTNVWSFRSGFSNYYRPLMHVIYMITYYIFGLSASGFHFVNILFHAGNSVLVFSLASTLCVNFSCRSSSSASPSTSAFLLSPPFIAALLFAVQPVHTEAVTWVAGLPELSYTFFSLLSLHLYTLSGGERHGAYLFSLLSFFLATLCKETALILPVLLPAYDFSFRRAPSSASAFRRLRSYLPYLAVAGISLALRLHALSGLTPVKAGYQLSISSGIELSAYQYFINVFPLFVQYLEKLFFPLNLNFWHAFLPITSLLTAKGLTSLFVTLLFFVFLVLAARRNKVALFALLLIIVPLIPSFYIPGIIGKPFAERYLYLPSFGFVMLSGIFLVGVAVRIPRRAAVIALLLAAVAGLYSAETVSRNAVWKDDLSLWSDTVKKSPGESEPRNELGSSLLKEGRVDEAIEQYKVALTLNSASAGVYNNLGIAYAHKGLPDKTIEYIGRSLQLEPGDANAHYNLGLAFMQKGLLGQAIVHFEEAVRLAPADQGFRDALERSYAMKRK